MGSENKSLDWLNQEHSSQVEDAFLRCCGSTLFAKRVCAKRPFADLQAVVQAARETWWNEVPLTGWLEAFAAHPRIGDVDSLRKKFAQTADWCEGEQSAALSSANEQVLQELADWNARYEARFGHIFIICASGKSSSEVLSALKKRYSNQPAGELQVAASEQATITELRLAKLLGLQLEPLPPQGELAPTAIFPDSLSRPVRRLQQLGAQLGPSPTDHARAPVAPQQSAGHPGGGALQSPITTHVLDQAHGRPAAGVAVTLDFIGGLSGQEHESWVRLGTGFTDGDGRCKTLMQPAEKMAAGVYKLHFESKEYFSRQAGEVGPNLRGDEGRVGTDGGFFPFVELVFEVKPSQVHEHFHVPLLLSPYAFSTYRGS